MLTIAAPPTASAHLSACVTKLDTASTVRRSGIRGDRSASLFPEEHAYGIGGNDIKRVRPGGGGEFATDVSADAGAIGGSSNRV